MGAGQDQRAEKVNKPALWKSPVFALLRTPVPGRNDLPGLWSPMKLAISQGGLSVP